MIFEKRKEIEAGFYRERLKFTDWEDIRKCDMAESPVFTVLRN